MDTPVKLQSKNEEEAPPKRQWVKNPSGIPEVYSNYMNASWSLFDARILFGHLKPTVGDSNEFVVEEQGAVILSWAQTKNLADLLNGMVEAYESVNGVIPRLKLAPRYEDIEK